MGIPIPQGATIGQPTGGQGIPIPEGATIGEPTSGGSTSGAASSGGAPQQPAEEPNFFTRTLGSSHPLDDLITFAHMMTSGHAGQDLKEAGGVELQGLGELAKHPVQGVLQLSGLHDLKKDFAAGNISATAGDIVQVGLNAIPFIKGAGVTADALKAGAAPEEALQAGLKATLKSGIGAGEDNSEKHALMPGKVGNVKIPRSAAEAGALRSKGAQSLERIIANMPGGSALKKVGEGQRAAAEQVLTNIAGPGAQAGKELPRSFLKLSDNTKELANPHFEAIRQVPASGAPDFNQFFDTLRSDKGAFNSLPTKLRQKLTTAVQTSINGMPSLSGEDLLDVRRHLSDAAQKLRGTPEGINADNLLHEWDKASESHLAEDPGLYSHWVRGRALWQRAKLQEDFANSLLQSISGSAQEDSMLPSSATFNKSINDLDLGEPIKRGEWQGMTPLEAAFGKEGAEQLRELGKVFQTSRGMSSSIAGQFGNLRILYSIGAAGSAVAGVGSGHAGSVLGGLAGLYATTKIGASVLAHPEAVKALTTIVKASGGAARMAHAQGVINRVVDEELAKRYQRLQESVAQPTQQPQAATGSSR